MKLDTLIAKLVTLIAISEDIMARPNSSPLVRLVNRPLQNLAGRAGRGRLSLRTADKRMLICMNGRHFFQDLLFSATPNGVECCLVNTATSSGIRYA